MQNAPECQDPVTTRQDRGQTCRDVFASMKSSFTSCGYPWDEVREAASTLTLVDLGVRRGRLTQGFPTPSGRIDRSRSRDSIMMNW
jgi:hypothetical protein